MRFLDYAPILHISALTGERTAKVLETIDKVAAARRQRVPTPALNRFVEKVTAANPPVSPGPQARADSVRGADRRRAAVVRVLHQRRDDVSLLLRAVPRSTSCGEEFGFVGSPIRIQVRRRDRTPTSAAPQAAPTRHGAEERAVQRERKDRRARKNRRDKKER